MSDKIRTTQLRLGRTIRRARAAEDRVVTRKVRELGQRLAHINYGLLQLVRLHDINNKALDKPVEEFRRVVAELIDLLGPVNLVCVEDQVYVNDIRVRFDHQVEHTEALQKMLRTHGVGGITYYAELSSRHVRQVVSLFNDEPARFRPRHALQENLIDAGLGTIELHPPFRFHREGEKIDKSVTDVYEASVGIVAETFANMGAGRLPNPLPVRRVVHDILDVTSTQDIARIALEVDATAPPFARHSLMVTNLSIMIGRAIGLSDASLANLGVAAMLHDIGFCTVEAGARTDFDGHPRAGLRVLLRQRGFHEARIQRMLVVVEHHDSHACETGRPSLHARIIHIADDYDQLTRHRKGMGPPNVPPDAIRHMGAATGTAYDPVLLQAFINTVGGYPPGTVLRLNDGTVVLSVSGARSPETFSQPRCKVMRLADGNLPDQDLWVDLTKGGTVSEVMRPSVTDADAVTQASIEVETEEAQPS